MTITAPPTDPAAEAEALFREAKLRTRRRRRRRAAASGIALALATIVYAVASAGDATPARSAPAGPLVDHAAFAGHGRLAFVSQGRLYLLDGTALTAVSRARPERLGPAVLTGRSLAHLSHGIGRGSTSCAPTAAARARWGASPGTQSWLPNGELIAGGAIWRVGASGTLTRVAAVPPGLVAWSPGGGRYRLLRGQRPQALRRADRRHGDDSRSRTRCDGPRTTWYTTHTSFTPRNGVQGDELDGALVLPGNGGHALPPRSGRLVIDLRGRPHGLPPARAQHEAGRPREHRRLLRHPWRARGLRPHQRPGPLRDPHQERRGLLGSRRALHIGPGAAAARSPSTRPSRRAAPRSPTSRRRRPRRAISHNNTSSRGTRRTPCGRSRRAAFPARSGAPTAPRPRRGRRTAGRSSTRRTTRSGSSSAGRSQPHHADRRPALRSAPVAGLVVPGRLAGPVRLELLIGAGPRAPGRRGRRRSTRARDPRRVRRDVARTRPTP